MRNEEKIASLLTSLLGYSEPKITNVRILIMVKAPRKTLKIISFSDFGQNFMNLVITENVIEGALEAGIPKTVKIKKIDGGMTIDSDAIVSAGRVKKTSKASDNNALKFDAPIDIKASIKVKTFNVDFLMDVSAQPAMELAIFCVEPLGIKIEVAKISESSFQVHINEENIPAKVANFFKDARPQVRQAIADGINDAIADAEEQLYIDVLGKVQETFKNSGTPANTPGGGKPSGPVKERILQLDAEPIEATLGEDQIIRLALPPQTSDTSEIITLARFADKDASSDATLAVTALDEDGGVLAEWTQELTVGESGWRKKAAHLWGHEIGSARQVFIEVKNVKSESGETAKLDVKVKRIAG